VNAVSVKESLKLVVDFVKDRIGYNVNRLPRQTFIPKMGVLVEHELVEQLLGFVFCFQSFQNLSMNLISMAKVMNKASITIIRHPPRLFG